MTTPITTVSYLIESRPRGTTEPWRRAATRSIAASWSDRARAERYLAERRERQPNWEHRMITVATTVTTTVTEEPTQ
ncbi:hypothetical protein [Streptomyces jumonjinensis]|uniref:Uncharacterized protein n=1 Tax=Streptomyces jumonjinensis TaxID=1945 RepID=A0A646KP47_STRJU|nr:hypothetical protein [Streptomyces jumonjinensis]MQT03880.1 hypothetical protein [Streptomyces jumonjinensis]